MSFIDKQLYDHTLLNYKTHILVKFWIYIAKKNTIFNVHLTQ